MTSPLILTTAWFRQHDACPEQVALFRRLFGPEALVCPETLDRALAAGLSVEWLGREVLTAAAWAEYDRAAAAARAAYHRVTAPAQAAYNCVAAAARAEYRRVADPAWAAYHRVVEAAWEECGRVTDAAIAALLADPANWKPEVLAELRGDA